MESNEADPVSVGDAKNINKDLTIVDDTEKEVHAI